MRLTRRKLAILTVLQCITLSSLTSIIIKRDDPDSEARLVYGPLTLAGYEYWSHLSDSPFPLTTDTDARPVYGPLTLADYGNCSKLDDVFFPMTTDTEALPVYAPLTPVVYEASPPGNGLVPCSTEDTASAVYAPPIPAVSEAPPPGIGLVPCTTDDTALANYLPPLPALNKAPPSRSDPVPYTAVLLSLMSRLVRFMLWLICTVKPILLELLSAADLVFGDIIEKYSVKQLVMLLYNKLTAAARYMSRMLNWFDIVLAPLRATVQRLLNSPPNALQITTAATPTVDAELQIGVQTRLTSAHSRPTTPFETEPPKPREEPESPEGSQPDSEIISNDDLMQQGSTEMTQMPERFNEQQLTGPSVVATSRAEQDTQSLEPTTNMEKEIYKWQCDKLTETLTTIATSPVDSRKPRKWTSSEFIRASSSCKLGYLTPSGR